MTMKKYDKFMINVLFLLPFKLIDVKPSYNKPFPNSLVIKLVSSFNLNTNFLSHEIIQNLYVFKNFQFNGVVIFYKLINICHLKNLRPLSYALA